MLTSILCASGFCDIKLSKGFGTTTNNGEVFSGRVVCANCWASHTHLSPLQLESPGSLKAAYDQLDKTPSYANPSR